MTNYSFDANSSRDKLRHLLQQHTEFEQDSTSTSKALELSKNAWHLIDWVYEEYIREQGQFTLGEFRETLYPECSSLKIMHDIANAAKHSTLSRPKAQIKDTRKHEGPFSSVFSREFDQTSLEIELENGTTLYFEDEIEKVVVFWRTYFRTQFNIEV